MKKNSYTKFIVTIILSWAACFIVLGVIYLLILRPQNNRLCEIQNKLAQTKQLCQDAEAATTLAAQAELNNQLNNIKGKLKDYVVDEKDCADLTFAISKIATEKNVTEFNIRTAESQQRPSSNLKNIFEKRFDVDFTSGFNQFASFLNTLERNQPVIFIDNFKMSRSENPSGHKFNMALVVLVRKKAE